MPKRNLAITISFFLIALLIAIYGLNLERSALNAESGELLDEARLRDTALQTARDYGLEGEPTILFSDYIEMSGARQVVWDGEIISQPEHIIYAVSLTGKFNTENNGNYVQTGITLGIHARTGEHEYTELKAVSKRELIRSYSIER